MTITLKNKDQAKAFYNVCNKFKDCFLIMEIYEKDDIPMNKKTHEYEGTDFKDLDEVDLKQYIGREFYFSVGDDHDVYDFKNNLDALELELKEEGIDVTYELDGEAYYGEPDAK